MNPYKWLWSKIGGRPWTYIWRDIYHEAEWLIQSFWFFLGFALAVYFCNSFAVFPLPIALIFKVAGILWIIYTFGYICGHVHWGTKWIKGEKGK